MTELCLTCGAATDTGLVRDHNEDRYWMDPARGAFRSPNVLHPVGSPGVQGITSAGTITPGWGAWELALRYSTMDLDDLPFAAVAANRVRGGVQDIWTVGLNWYINNAIKTQLNYQYVDVNRLNADAAGLEAILHGLR